MYKVEAVYFGNYFKRFFALLFRPNSKKSAYSVLICKPIGQEDIRSQKAILQLSKELAGHGVVTMVFDYYGTGDSPGKFEDVTVGSCLESIKESVAYLKTQCETEKIIVIGVRAGALFANAARNKIQAELLVLWNPVLEGLDYLRELKKQHHQWLLGSFVANDGVFKRKHEYLGFLYDERFLQEIAVLKIDVDEGEKNKNWLFVGHREQIKTNTKKHSRAISGKSKESSFWMKGESDEPIVPTDDINIITEWIRSRSQTPQFIK